MVLESFIVSANIMVPFVLLALLGILMRRIGFIADKFVRQGNKVLFYFGIPVTIFNTIHRANLGAIFDVQFILFNIAFMVVFFLATWLLAWKLMSDKSSVSSFVNSAYRSSLSVVAPPLFGLMFIPGSDTHAQSLFIMSILLVMSYATASVLFAVHNSKDKKISGFGIVKDVCLSVAKNPIVIGVVIGFIVNFLGWRLPITNNYHPNFNPTHPLLFLSTTVESLARLVMPLAMICVGANLKFDGFSKKFKYVIIGVIVKLFIMPIVAIIVAYLLGFRGNDLTIIMILSALPMAVGAYVMQAELGCGDLYIGSSTLMITMVLSAFTLTMFIFFFHVLGFFVV